MAIDLATHDLDVMQHVLGQSISEIYADGGRFLHSSQEDLLTCLVRFSAEGEGDTLGLLDVNWLTPEKTREIVLIGENGLLRASYITQDVWFVESPTRAAALGRPLDAARRRRGRRGAVLARQGRAAAGRAGSLLPLRARRHAGADQRPRRRQGAGRGASGARVGGGAPAGRAARRSPTPRPLEVLA